MTQNSPDYPFDTSGVVRDENGGKRYSGLTESLVTMLRAQVQAAPGAEAIVDLKTGERVDYQSLWQRAARVAGGLKAQNLVPGDRAAICLGNGLDWVLAFFGCQLAGVAAVPVNTRFARKEQDYVINDSGATYIFKPDAALPDDEPYEYIAAKSGDMAAIFYTSGTTGFPKGAITTHGNFTSNNESCRRCIELTGDGKLRNLVAVPLFHATGCHSQLLATLSLGGCVVIMPEFEVGAFLRAIVTENINQLVAVPAIYWLAINQPQFAEMDVSQVRWLLYGGAPIAPDLVAKLKKAFPNARLGNGFGLTETASITTVLPHEYADDYADSVGFAAPVMEVKLKDPDPETGVGELLIRGSNVVAGYWNKPEANEQAFAGGWLHSGDLARINDKGIVFIVDRAKDMINRGGENVYCVEVENALAGHPDVFEAAVIGVADNMMGEKVGAVLVATPGQEIDPQDVVAYCRKHIGDFKVPQYIRISPEPLPRNPGGKVLKPQLREQDGWGEALF